MASSSKMQIKKIILRKISFAVGFILTIITILPLPWRVRCTWARVLAFGRNAVFGLFSPASMLKFVETQNVDYNIGSQDSGVFMSTKQFESILEFADTQNISFAQLKSILEFADTQKISFEQLKSILEFADTQKISFAQLKSILEFAET